MKKEKYDPMRHSFIINKKYSFGTLLEIFIKIANKQNGSTIKDVQVDYKMECVKISDLFSITDLNEYAYDRYVHISGEHYNSLRFSHIIICNQNGDHYNFDEIEKILKGHDIDYIHKCTYIN